MKAPAMAKLATDELVTHELATDELVMYRLATDKLVTEIQPKLPASKPELVPMDDLDLPKASKSMTSSPGPTTIP